MNASDSRTANVREIATRILVAVDTRKAFADRLLDRALESGTLPARDRALLSELTYGTLRWRGRLDWLLRGHLKRDLARTSPFVRNLLRLTLYQLFFLDRVPDYAAVNEAVALAKTRGGVKSGGFVNAVLRGVLREGRRKPPPELSRETLSEFASYWSHPLWLVELWQDYFAPEELVPLLEADNRAAPLALRAQRLKTTVDDLLSLLAESGVEARPSLWSTQGVVVLSRRPPDQLPGFDEGLFFVQGEASQLIGFLLDPRPGERILDACAAPGGKTTHIAELIEDRGTVVAADLSAAGLERVRRNARRLRLTSIRTVCCDMTAGLPEAEREPYDRILVDAPCSGLGTLRSHPEIKWNRAPADIARLSRTQRKILKCSAGYLRTGGVLVYSTCTLARPENEDVVEGFLRQHPEFVLEEAAGYLPEKARALVRGPYFLALPHRHDTDGFFAARMRKAR
ncbi:MAG TPA: 16S rRNA (cytosine(967)-C(5))-methyltransferase RsmB [candidate division Zixibacteria bacterium]|nr:16S rRNA (cytosine(967)-C(5))-methyltransferase RsmB [candidate division Zixibacteria bacterium]